MVLVEGFGLGWAGSDDPKPLIQRALTILENSAALVDSDLAVRLGNLAFVLRGTKDADKAARFLRRAISILEKTPRLDDENLAMALNNLGCALWTNQMSEAEALLSHAITILLRCTKAAQEEHPHLRKTIRNLFHLYEQAHREDTPLEQLSGIATEAGFDRDEIDSLLEWWQDGEGESS